MLLALLITLASVSVSGRVVDAETQTPIAGARVVIAPADAASPPGATSLDEVVTDKEGRFIFAAVEPGRYRLDALKKGFAPLVNRSTSTAAIVDVAETPVEGLELAMTRGGAISGRIVESSGTPRPRLVVSALNVSDTPADSAAPVTAKVADTDEEGAFVLQDLPEGSYLVMAAPQSSSGLSPTASVAPVPSPTYYPGTGSKDAAQIITIAQGQAVTDLQFSMVSARGYQINGVAVDGTGAPVSDALIALMMEGRNGAVGVSSIATPDVQGLFQIEGVAPGTYRLIAIVGADVNSGLNSVISIGGGSAGGNAPASGILVTVKDGDVRDVRIVVPARR